MNMTFIGILLALSLSTNAFAANATSSRPFGLGVVFGEPTGFTAKYWLSQRGAVDAGLAFSVNSFFLLYSDYLWHFPRAFSRHGGSQFVNQLTPYLGVGGVLLFSTKSNRTDNKYFTTDGASTGFGIRIPLGLEWRVNDPSIGVFFELVPGLGVIPSGFAFFEAGIGARYYF